MFFVHQIQQIPSCDARVGTPSKASLDQLNESDLLKTLNRLDFSALVDVADFGGRYRELVIHHYMIPVFKVHEKSFNMLLIMAPSIGYYDETKVYSDAIVFRKVESFTKALRNVGHLISKVFFNGSHKNESAEYSIGKSMNQYCRDSLVELSLRNFRGILTVEWKAPFAKLEKVTLYCGTLNTKTASQLNKFFPKVRCMKLLELWANKTSSIEQSFPFLEDFEYYEHPHAHSMDIKKFITLNRQLKTLNIRANMDAELPKVMNETLPHLEELTIFLGKTDQFKDSQPTYLSNVKRLKVESQSSDYRTPKYFPFILPELEVLEVDLTEDTNKWMKIITEMKWLKKLRLLRGAFTTKQWINITSELTNLDELVIEFHQLDKRTVIETMGNQENLKMITFRYIKEKDREYIRNRVDRDWKMTDLIFNLSKADHDTVFKRVNN